MRNNPRHWLLVFFSFLFLLSSCQGLPTQDSSPLPTLTAWRVRLSPSLTWLAVQLNICTYKQPGIGILLDNSSQESDIRLVWGTPSDEKSNFIYTLGWDELILVVNPQNTIQSLDVAQVRSIFQGQIRSWPPPSAELGNISVWVYPDSNDIQKIFDQTILSTSTKNTFASIAPSPAALQTNVANNPSAIGLLPRHWMTSRLRSIEIKSDPPLAMRLPILAILSQKPSNPVQNWLLCLQSAIAGSNTP